MNKIAISKESLTTLSYVLAIPGLKLIYFFLNRIPRSAKDISIFIDAYIPLIPIFVVPYIIFYPFVFAGLFYLFIKKRSAYIHTVKAYSVGLVICYLTYLLYQTTMPRPELVNDGIFTKIIGLIYSIDEPLNALPSIHVLGTMITVLGLKEAKLNNFYLNITGWLIIASTVFVKQHGILDVVAGLGLSYVVYNLTEVSKESQRQITQI